MSLTSVPDPDGQVGLLGVYEREGFWQVTIFQEHFDLIAKVEAALGGDYSPRELIAHEDDLTLHEGETPHLERRSRVYLELKDGPRNSATR